MQIVLGSQSPRRRELLQTVVPNSQLQVIPPIDPDEPGFDGLTSDEEISSRLSQIVDGKSCDVQNQLAQNPEFSDFCLICADTTVVASTPSGGRIVLGKPPVEDWKSTVKEWFQLYYNERPHEVWTCCRVVTSAQQRDIIVKTVVKMIPLDDWLIDWYLATDEPLGKAGGYAIQGRAALLIDHVDGSLTNVIGLPMAELTSVLREFQVMP